MKRLLLVLLLLLGCAIEAHAQPLYVQYHMWYTKPASCPASPASTVWYHWDWWSETNNACNFVGGTSWLRDVSAVTYPITGPYHSNNMEVFRWQIRVAKAAGIDGFLLSTFPATSDGPTLISLFLSHLQIAAEENFKVGLEVWAPNNSGEVSTFYTQTKSHIDQALASQYNGALLRINGKLAVWFVFWSRWDTLSNLATNLLNTRDAFWLISGDLTVSELNSIVLTNGSQKTEIAQHSHPTTTGCQLLGDLSDTLNLYGGAGYTKVAHFYTGFNEVALPNDPGRSPPRYCNRGNFELLDGFFAETAVGNPAILLAETFNDFSETLQIGPGIDMKTWRDLGQETIYNGDPYRTMKAITSRRGLTWVTPPPMPCAIVDPLMVSASIVTCSSDTTAPSTPGTPSLVSSSATTANISWSASTDSGGAGLYSYLIERCSGSSSCTNYVPLTTTTSTSYTDTGLTTSTVYRYRVKASDNAQNFSSPTAALNVTPSGGSSQPATFVLAHDTIPNFAYTPTITSIANGNWNANSTWSCNCQPASTDVVLVQHTVTYNTTSGIAKVIGIDTGAALNFSTSTNTSLQVGTLEVMPGGTLTVGTITTPVPAGTTAEIVIRNIALDNVGDPDQFGTGILVIDGTIKMHGAVKTPWVRFGAEPTAGQTSLTLGSSVSGWVSGDRVTIPDTRHMRYNEIGGASGWDIITPQYEERTVSSASGTSLVLSSALTYDHLGARDGDNTLRFLPHVMNLTRNVTVRSENSNTATGTVQGHGFITNRSDADIRYVLFKQMGRTINDPLDSGTPSTNHIGRYPLHFHHNYGPTAIPSNGYQFTAIGNAFDGGTAAHKKKWMLTVHDSHYGLVQQNVFYNCMGACFVAEDGSETNNLVDSNFGMRSDGSGNRGDGRGFEDLAHDGTVFWSRGFRNIFTNNVAANAYGTGPDSHYGYKLFAMFAGNVPFPNYQGASTSTSGQYTTMGVTSQVLNTWNNNEVYASESGLTFWWLGLFGDGNPNPGQGLSTFSHLIAWHNFNNSGVFTYEHNNVVMDGFIILGKQPDGTAACCHLTMKMQDYTAQDSIVRNWEVQGLLDGIQVSTFQRGNPFVIENSYFRVPNGGISFDTLWTSSADPSGVPPRHVILRNNTFAAWPGQPLKSIVKNWTPTGGGTKNTTQLDETIVRNYQGTTNDFQVYFAEQATQNIAGGLAPCTDTTTHPEVGGITCAIAEDETGGSRDPIVVTRSNQSPARSAASTRTTQSNRNPVP